jgi:hypothetical protein
MKSVRCVRALPALLAGLMLLAAVVPATAQSNPNEKVIKPGPNSLDRDDIYDKDGKPKADSKLWVLDVKVKPLRSIVVDVPGRGKQVCWYLWYQVTNHTAGPHTFVPDFELVTQDTRQVYKDEILPKVQDAIIAQEDPTGTQDIKNSVSITREPIPPLKPNALPKPVTGVAIFTDKNEPLPGDSAEVKAQKAKLPRLSDSNFFNIYVAGLSNGWAEAEAVGGKGEIIVRRKTLNLKFRRIGDGALGREEDIRYIGHEWLYRASALSVPNPTAAGAPDKPKDNP